MKSIECVRDVLRNIDALDKPPTDPTAKPTILVPPENVTMEMDSLPVFDSGYTLDYPDWVDAEIFDPLDAAVAGQMDRLGPHTGTDALAWYVSFHHEGPDWGIYVPVSSLAYLQARVFAAQNTGKCRAFDIGLQTLLAHEFVHFAVDYTCAQWEILLHTPFWKPSVAALKSGNTSYFRCEEQLANAAMLRNCHSLLTASERRALRRFVASQPPGYRDAPTAIEQTAFEHTFSEVLKQYVGLQAVSRGIDLCTSQYDQFVHLPHAEAYTHADCPVHIIPNEAIVGLPGSILRFIRFLNVVDETLEFKQSLARVEEPVRKKWARIKKRAAEQGLTRGDGFESINGEYSIRLNRNFRAHLEPIANCVSGSWRAIRLGTHKEMGHG